MEVHLEMIDKALENNMIYCQDVTLKQEAIKADIDQSIQQLIDILNSRKTKLK